MVSRLSSAVRFGGLIAITGSALLLGGCKGGGLLNLQGKALPPPETQSFEAGLADEYQVLAEFTAGTPQTRQLASIFYEKSAAAAKGTLVSPESLADYKVPAFARDDLRQARDRLMAGLTAANTPQNARMLAMAQVKFDCWLAYQPYQKNKDGYIGCRDSFQQAMANIDFSRTVAKATPAQKSVSSPEAQTIHFINDTMTLDQGAHAAIAALAETALANEGTGILLVGYSKAAATIEDTSNNAVRRIIAVRNALYQNGVDPDLVKIEFVKGGDPQDVDMELLPGIAGGNS